MYFVALREDEAEELMEEHVIGELVLCKDCEHGEKCVEPHKDYWCNLYDAYKSGGLFCADGERKNEEC